MIAIIFMRFYPISIMGDTMIIIVLTTLAIQKPQRGLKQRGAGLQRENSSSKKMAL